MSTAEGTVTEQQLDTAPLKRFAQAARRQLLDAVASKLDRVLAEGSLARRESEKSVKQLESQIAESSREQLVERVAYTWFNRFCALRFMDVNRYTPIGTVSPAEGFSQPEILMDAKHGHIDDDWTVDKARVLGLLDGSLPSDDAQQEAYQLLLVAVCNSYHTLMPFMFERIADYTELLIPDDLLSDSSILAHTREALTPEACQSVETIGWLYQFYISEKKDDVFAALKKGKKITPENIPAATQLFTPHWIVRYLVENSLGRLWMLNHPDSRLIEQMDYFIRPEEPETDFLQISSPEEIKICDPACGSGHMLTYAFDLLYAIYEEQGYQATDIARLILTHNLYGIEIDQRAGALAAFALTMKAREKYRRFLQSGKVVQPNICVLENIHIDPEDLSAYMDKVGRDLFSGGLQGVVNQWEEADNFGSLIRPLVADVSEVLELLRERQMGEDLFFADVHQKVVKALRQADYLSPKYHVVVANPPYMGGSGMNGELSKFAKQKYAESKADTFAMFLMRGFEMVRGNGYVSMITMQNWMFLSSFEELRRDITQQRTIVSLVQIGFNSFPELNSKVAQACAFVASNTPQDVKGVYYDLNDNSYTTDKNELFLSKLSANDCFRRSSSYFNKIPGCPIAYSMPIELALLFDNKALDSVGHACSGIQTGDNERYLRLWFEVGEASTAFGYRRFDTIVAESKRWVPHKKGGPFRKWYGNDEYVVDWKHDGKSIKSNPSARPQNLEMMFRTGATWSHTGTKGFGARIKQGTVSFNVEAPCLLCKDELWATALLNSAVSNSLLTLLAPTLHFLVGTVKLLPVPETDNHRDQIVELASKIVMIAKEDWDRVETSWDFQSLEMLRTSESKLDEAFLCVRDTWRNNTSIVLDLETKTNRAIKEEFGILCEGMDTPHLSDVTLNGNPVYCYGEDKSESELEALLLADTMREFISYAVGCMLGRYSLDKPGLILANQGETADDYRQQIPEPTFAPDEDNVIPLLDGDWFTDDISERFKEFLKVTFGTEHYEENLTFLENGLYPDNLTGKKRKTIRDYFLKEFYNHHIKLYKKRPIYWLFSSPKGTFNALIYMHRYRPDTVSVVLNDYLREFHTKLTAKVDHLQAVADSGTSSQSDKTKALKEISKLKKQIKELEDYERDILFPLAQQQMEIDLDDGVKVNYNKFGKALKSVTGLTGR